MTVFENAELDDHESVHHFFDRDTGLRAIVAIHSTMLGPAAGGCRFWDYADEEAALFDVLRLSRGMSYKNAIAGLPLGGGKAVVIGDSRTIKNDALLYSLGRAIDSLNGRYITAEDVGVSVQDMAIVSQATPYVSGLPKFSCPGAPGGDPSPKTAKGVFYGIEKAVDHRLSRSSVEGLTVAVQGLGNVGYRLCRFLHAAGATLIVSDIDAENVTKAVDAFGATAASVDEILFVKADVLAPCALGGVLNRYTVPRLQAAIVAGAANNQLLSDEDGKRLKRRNILYAPDYVINAGGIINVAAEYLGGMSGNQVDERVMGIGTSLAEIFERADFAQSPTNEIADEMARLLLMDQGRAIARLAYHPRPESKSKRRESMVLISGEGTSFDILAEHEPGTLSRVLEFFSLRGIAPIEIRASKRPDGLQNIALTVESLGPGGASCAAAKILGIVTVLEVKHDQTRRK